MRVVSKEAREKLRAALQSLEGYGENADTQDGLRLLRESLDRLERYGEFDALERKRARYRSMSYRKMSSAQMWTDDDLKMPSFKNPQASLRARRRMRRQRGDTDAGNAGQTDQEE